MAALKHRPHWTAPFLCGLLLALCACGPGVAPLPAAPTLPPAPTVAPAQPAAPTGAPVATGAPASTVGATDPVNGDIIVFAASSLTDALKEIAAAFQREHPAARVVLSFGGSSQLAIQLINGARADVFASADQDQMDAVARGKALAHEQQIFVRNRLMVIAPHDNPGHVTSLGDLARPGLKVIGAQAAVPIGAYTASLLKSASSDPTYGADFERRVERNMVSREDTVRQIVARIQLGEADAAVVYTTDVTEAVADQFVRIPLPEELSQKVIARYPIAVANGRNRAGGEAFVAFVESSSAQNILARWGFLPSTDTAA